MVVADTNRILADSSVGRVKAPIVMGIILAWAVAMVTFMAWLMAGRLVPLPEPAAAVSGDQASAVLNMATTNLPAAGRWRMVHILVAGCPCSSYTAQYLSTRKPVPDCQETVLVLGGSTDWEPSLTQAGFDVRDQDGEKLQRETGIAGGPWLLIISPGGKIAYSGGYATQRPRPGVTLHDLELFQSARAHETVAAYPAFGCSAAPLAPGGFDPVAVCRNLQ